MQCRYYIWCRESHPIYSTVDLAHATLLVHEFNKHLEHHGPHRILDFGVNYASVQAPEGW